MGKKEDLIKILNQLKDNTDELEEFIVKNSNLPGPRGNLELAFAFSEIYNDLNVLYKWLTITEDQADVNNPRSFLPFCSAVCLGKVYTKNKNIKIISTLKKLANDGRWRMREAVAFGFQIIGEYDFNELKTIFSEWIDKSNNLEKRAIIASLAHPRFLDHDRAKYCFEITNIILKDIDKKNNFDILKKGLSFTISVFTAANPECGFNFIKRWIRKDKEIDKIMKENLKKNRLSKKHTKEVEDILNLF